MRKNLVGLGAMDSTPIPNGFFRLAVLVDGVRCSLTELTVRWLSRGFSLLCFLSGSLS